MSNQSTSKEQNNPAQGRQPGGGRRQGAGQNRNRNRNNNNRNRNRNRNNRGGGGGQGQRRNPQQRHEIKPAPLTFWQKILKALGLYKPQKKSGSSRVPKPTQSTQNKSGNKTAPKRNQRDSSKPKGSGKNQRKREPQENGPVTTGRLYLGNLSYEATEYELEDLFKGIGPVKSIEIVYNRNTHKSKGYGFVVMRSVEDAQRAVEVLHDQPFMGRQLIVSGAKSKGPATEEAEQESSAAPSESTDDSAGGDEAAA